MFVLALVGGTAVLARRFGLGNRAPIRRGGQRRLAILDSTVVDAKRRLILVRRDQTEHLLLVGGANELLIETAIAPPQDAPQP
jgi:flagellar protein FliO/FliZ